jgi:hypothetical protein
MRKSLLNGNAQMIEVAKSGNDRRASGSRLCDFNQGIEGHSRRFVTMGISLGTPDEYRGVSRTLSDKVLHR